MFTVRLVALPMPVALSAGAETVTAGGPFELALTLMLAAVEVDVRPRLSVATAVSE